MIGQCSENIPVSILRQDGERRIMSPLHSIPPLLPRRQKKPAEGPHPEILLCFKTVNNILNRMVVFT